MGLKFNPISGFFDLSGGGAAAYVGWKDPVDTEADLPIIGNIMGS